MSIRQYHDMPYVDRDESWMYFNRRLIDQAQREDVPLLERLNFLGIYSSNLDEFFRVRVASLRRMADSSSISPEDREEVRRLLLKLARLNAEYSELYEHTLSQLVEALSREHIHIISEQELTPSQGEEVRHYFMEHISSSINPILIHPKTVFQEGQFKEALYLAVCLKPSLQGAQEEDTDLALIELPIEEQGRFIRLENSPEGEGFLIFLDDVVRYCLPYIFVGMPYLDFEAYTFKLTKDSEMDIESDLRSSVLEKISQGIKRRKRALPIRLVYDRTMPEPILGRIIELLDSEPSKLIQLGGGRYHDMKNLMKLPDLGHQALRYPEWKPRPSREAYYSKSLLGRILRQDIGIHFPYESFDGFLRLLREAAIHPDVREIRTTLYRVAHDSRVVRTLRAAAQNGKRVIVVVELLARFDEQSNVQWSKKMQDSGIKVIIGHEQLKIHTKLVHITTTQGDIACVSTGNLHEGTARFYTDYMIMTANPKITTDVRAVFDFIERPFIPAHFANLLVAPNELRRRLVALIDREIVHAKAGREAYIKMKINHIVDEDMVRKLYEASQAGVAIHLAVRGCCSLVPGVEGFSERITVNAIIDRYLEHARIYIFGNGGDKEVYLGSSDWMPRNLDRRVEVMAPVYDEAIKEELDMVVSYALKDNQQGFWVNERSGASRRLDADEARFRSQEALYNYYQNKHG